MVCGLGPTSAECCEVCATIVRALLPALADLSWPQHVHPAGYAREPRRVSDLGGDGGLDARLRPGRARHPHRAAADARDERPAGDDREDDSTERALVQGRARQRAVPLAHVAAGFDGLQRRAVAPPRRQQGRRVADRRRRLSADRLPRLAPGLPLRRSSAAVHARHRVSVGLARLDHLGGRDRDPGSHREPDAVVPREVSIARTSLRAKLWGTFRCQTYWLLATRGAWRVLWALVRTASFEPAKTDRVVRP